ncbi:helix-turn-helix domain-containing protein [Luteipulveratus mongoliensis]|uniref:helix-turn-helix domain-containing protein n=1 Tax=Luteipulveratus mongoliensis TaxID=571913 RepID=UPI0006965A69|nr:helix-turn-helix transcriptional regulator [Luteipulveratus mongoliensis]
MAAITTTERARSAAWVDRLVEKSGLTATEVAEKVGTSPSRLSAYRSGDTIPSAVMVMRMMDIAGRVLPSNGTQWASADETTEAVERDYKDHPSDALRWLLQGRDQLLSAPRSQARLLWDERVSELTDDRWETLMRVITAVTFRKKGLEPPAWAQPQRVSPDWTPLTRISIRPSDPIDPDLAQFGIQIRAKDLVTL